jgi:hypothetical protein
MISYVPRRVPGLSSMEDWIIHVWNENARA